MTKRRISANRIYTATNNSWLKNGIIEIDEQNRISNIIANANNREIASSEFYNGIIIPSFINAHSHIELSHLKNKIDKNTGLGGFIAQLNDIRNNFSLIEKQKAQKKAAQELLQNGIIAIGDISNSTESILIKSEFSKRLYFHNFVETWAFSPNEVKERMQKAKILQKLFLSISPSTITAHAPYSVCTEFIDRIAENAKSENGILSIHHQESLAEDLLLSQRKGNLFDILNQRGNNLETIAHAQSSAVIIKQHILAQNQLLLVHNTFSTEKDIKMLTAKFPELYWTLCPNANLFIENSLPNIYTLKKHSSQICLGTDSLASNNALSLFSEMLTIQNNFPKIDFTELLKWATINGAKALKIENQYGSIEKGKKAALNLMYPFNFKQNKMMKESKIKRLN